MNDIFKQLYKVMTIELLYEIEWQLNSASQICKKRV